MTRRGRLALLAGMMVMSPLATVPPARAQHGSDPTANKVDAVFADMAKADAPGCALGVIRDGRLIYSKGYGQAVIEHGVPITPRTVFDIGSVSKHFTAAAIVLLAQRGKLSLDDEVRKWVPEFPDYAMAGTSGEGQGARKNPTIRNLLHHTGGVRNYDTLMALAAVDFSGRTGDQEALDVIVRQKELNFAPGEEYLYSNSGYFLLSQIVKAASGQTLREFAAENMFKPLGMLDTQFLDDTRLIVPRRATAYAPKEKGGFQVDMSGFEQTGDGAVQTTVEDFLLWDQNFTSGKVLGQDGLALLQTPGVLNDGKKITYAFGLVVSTYRGLPVVEHGGSWAGYRAYYLRFPAQKFSVACLCNVGNANPSRRARQVAEIYLGSQLSAEAGTGSLAGTGTKEAAAELAAGERGRYVGLYRNSTAGGLRRVVEEQNALRVRVSGQAFDLIPAGPQEFRWVTPGGDVRVRFEPREDGKFSFVQFNAEGTTTAYDPVDPFAPSLEQLREFTGQFYSEEAGVAYIIFLKDGRPRLRIGRYTEMPIEPVFRDAFSFRMGQLIFERDAAGRVSHFSVQAGRVRNIRFLRVK